MEEEHEFKYVCKFCPKSFPCGRSLGGHTRSHMNNSTETDEKFIKKKLDQDISGGYILRQKPKKTWRRSSLFGHTKCYASENENQDSRSIVFRSEIKRKRTRNNKVVPANSTSMSEIEQEQQQEVALSLIMLSRDIGQWVSMNSTDETSANSFKNLESATMESESFGNGSKRKFQCSSCNKNFLSHQALGGHRASHKRINGSCNENSAGKLVGETPMAPDDIVAEDDRCHECPICFKVFISGQALGGHKRSHLLTDSRPKLHEMREFLDLNLPAPAEEDETTVHVGLNQWWVDSSHIGFSSPTDPSQRFLSRIFV